MTTSNLNSIYRRTFQTLRRKRPTATTTSTLTESIDSTTDTTNNAANDKINDTTINAPFQTLLSLATTKYRDEKRKMNDVSPSLSSPSLSPSTPPASPSISDLNNSNDDVIQSPIMNDQEVGAPITESNLKSFGGRLRRPPIGQDTKVHKFDLVSIGGRLVRFKDNDNNSSNDTQERTSNLSSGGSFAATMSATAKHRLHRQNLNEVAKDKKNPSILSIPITSEDTKLSNNRDKSANEEEEKTNMPQLNSHTDDDNGDDGKLFRNGMTSIAVGGTLASMVVYSDIIPMV